MKFFSYKYIIYYILNLSFVIYILAVLGIFSQAPKYLSIIREFLKIYIGIILIFFYNPFIKINKKPNSFDKILFFNSGILLILSSFFYTYVEYFIPKRLII